MGIDTDKIKKPKATGPVRYKLKQGQALYDKDGNLISEMPGVISEKELAMLKKAQGKTEKKSGPDLTNRAKGGMINKYAGGGMVEGYRKGGSVKNKKAGRLAKRGYGICKK